MGNESASEFILRKKLQFTAVNARAIRMKDIGRKGTHDWVHEAGTLMQQSNLPEEKILVIERLRRVSQSGMRAHRSAQIGDVEYRIGYFVRGKIGRAMGRWTWGQYSPLIPCGDFKRLLAKARQEGTIR